MSYRFGLNFLKKVVWLSVAYRVRYYQRLLLLEGLVVTGCVQFMTSQYEIKFMFPIQPFVEVC